MLNDTARIFLLSSDAITDTVHIRCCQDRVVTVGIVLCRRRHSSNSSSSVTGSLLLNMADRCTFVDRRPLLIASGVHFNPFVLVSLFNFKNHSETITESGQAVGSSRRLRSSSQTQSRNAFLLATDSSSSPRRRRDLASKQDNTSIDSSLATYASISFVAHDTFTLSTQKTDFSRICFAAVNLS